MHIVKNRIKNIKMILGCAVFLAIAFSVICSLTYLFRGNQYNYEDRISVVGIKEEVHNSLDVIYVGGSAAFVYWEPLKAFEDYGFTSYDLASNTIQAESILHYIKYAEKYQEPKLYIIDARAFQYYTPKGSEVGLRVSTDALDVGINRMALIKKYLGNREMDTDELALYWDLAKYHTNYEALSNPTAWTLMDNSKESKYKGCQIQTAWCYLEEPKGFQTKHHAELYKENEKTLKELLEYCRENDLNVLFVVCPYSISKEDYSIYNSIGDIVSSYGYEFLNTNDYYKEMKIDFACDFYNENHVNSYGAEKYTQFLEDYLVKNYELPDHRNELDYSGWNESVQKFNERVAISQYHVQLLIDNAEEGLAIGEVIKKTDSFLEWGNLINDSRYTVAVVGDATSLVNIDYADENVLVQNGFGDFFGKDNVICLASGGKILDVNSDGQENIMIDAGLVLKNISCGIVGGGQKSFIKKDETEYSLSTSDGLNVVVFDNQYGNLVDSVTLIKGENGNVNLVRQMIDVE